MKAARKPNARKKGITILVQGDAGTGKTVFGLSFPKVKLIDAENGAAWYESNPKYNKNLVGIWDTQSFMDLEEILDDVLEDKELETLVIDSETKLYENMQEVYLTVDEKREMKKHENDDNFSILDVNISQRSWGSIKRVAKKLQNAKLKLASSGVNVVSISQLADIKKPVKVNGSVKEIKVGEKASMVNKAEHDYDVVLKFFVDEDGTHKAEVLKDRTDLFNQHDIIENPSYDIWAERLAQVKDKEVIMNDYTADLNRDMAAYDKTLGGDNNPKTLTTILAEATAGMTKAAKTKWLKDALAEVGAKNLKDLSSEQVDKLKKKALDLI